MLDDRISSYNGGKVMGSGFSKMKKQRKQMEEQFARMQEELANSEHEGSAGGGLVKIVLTGDKNIKSIKISPECVDKEDVEGLQDLIIAAFNDAAARVEASSPMNGFIQ